MTTKTIPTLEIGDLNIWPPIIQGGMGVRVSGARLASAVANEGCVEEKVDMIISGAGLPLDLPKQTAGSNIKLVPIVSSARALNIIYRKWKQNYNKVPDAVVVEGPMAGGILGSLSMTLSIIQHPRWSN